MRWLVPTFVEAGELCDTYRQATAPAAGAASTHTTAIAVVTTHRRPGRMLSTLLARRSANNVAGLRGHRGTKPIGAR
jgi:hypothetical protein